MTHSTTTSAVASAAAACVLSAALAACAAPRESSADAVASLRVTVRLVRASEDATAIAAEATRVAGVAVTYAAATSTSWHALVLHCADAAQCAAAVTRLRTAGAIYRAVEIDGRKTRSAS